MSKSYERQQQRNEKDKKMKDDLRHELVEARHVIAELREEVLRLELALQEKHRVGKSFDAAWAEKQAAGYLYGDNEIELVRMGWNMAQERTATDILVGFSKVESGSGTGG